MATGQAERLFGLLEEVLREARAQWSDLAAIAVATGPGNFTGVRIAVSAARGLALSLGIPAVGTSVLQALAWPVTGRTLITLDARRDRLFAQSFYDGKPEDEAELVTWDTIAARAPDRELRCIGFRSREIARVLGAKSGGDQIAADPLQIALCAMPGIATNAPRPSPIYLRPPDAALPADPPPVILHDA